MKSILAILIDTRVRSTKRGYRIYTRVKRISVVEDCTHQQTCVLIPRSTDRDEVNTDRTDW